LEKKENCQKTVIVESKRQDLIKAYGEKNCLSGCNRNFVISLYWIFVNSRCNGKCRKNGKKKRRKQGFSVKTIVLEKMNSWQVVGVMHGFFNFF
jgi:hypothetical protein